MQGRIICRLNSVSYPISPIFIENIDFVFNSNQPTDINIHIIFCMIFIDFSMDSHQAQVEERRRDHKLSQLAIHSAMKYPICKESLIDAFYCCITETPLFSLVSICIDKSRLF